MRTLMLLSLVAILLGAGAATAPDAGVPKKPDAGVVDAGTADAGVDKDAVTKRRFKLLMIVNEFKGTVGETGAVVKIEEILFASVSAPEKDAAMVLATINGKRIGNFFIYDNGAWTVFPTDFSPEAVQSVP